MESEWNEVQLQDVVTKLGDGLHGTPKYTDDGEYYFINGNNLVNGKIVLNKNTKRVDKVEYEKHKKELTNRTVFVSINGTIGNVAFYNNEKVILGKSACYFSVKENVDKVFIRYIVSSPYFMHYLETFATGTTIKNISLKSMREFPFKLPPLPEQKAIAHILGCLDDKIGINRQINRTLEQMAQALFKSWFIDFDPVIDNALQADNKIPHALKFKAKQRQELGRNRKPLPEHVQKLFPSEFEFDENLDKWIPMGWRVESLNELINFIGGGTPKTSIEEYWNGNIHWFSVVDAPNDSDVFVINTEKKITQQGVDKSSTKILREGTTIISARGTVGKCAMVGFPMAMNQSCYGIQGKDGTADIFTYYTIRENVSKLQQRGHGSVFNTITKNTFKSIKLARGEEDLSQAFDDLIKHYFERIKSNLFQITKLTNLRDTLLPKLISGELRVGEQKK